MTGEVILNGIVKKGHTYILVRDERTLPGPALLAVARWSANEELNFDLDDATAMARVVLEDSCRGR